MKILLFMNSTYEINIKDIVSPTPHLSIIPCCLREVYTRKGSTKNSPAYFENKSYYYRLSVCRAITWIVQPLWLLIVSKEYIFFEQSDKLCQSMLVDHFATHLSSDNYQNLPTIYSVQYTSISMALHILLTHE